MAAIRMGIIGCGNFMSTHIPRLLDIDDVEIVGLADPQCGFHCSNEGAQSGAGRGG